MGTIDKVLAAIREEEKQHRSLAPAWGDVHNECADEWREAAEQLLALQAENANLRKCVAFYADSQMWIDLTTKQFGTIKAMHEGPEPAQKCLEELK